MGSGVSVNNRQMPVWREGGAVMMGGERLPNWSVGNTGNALELAPLLTARADVCVATGHRRESTEF
jgi:hypothetical protein